MSSAVTIRADIFDVSGNNLRYAGFVLIGSNDTFNRGVYSGELCGSGMMNPDDVLFFQASTNWIFNQNTSSQNPGGNGSIGGTYNFVWNNGDQNNPPSVCKLTLNAFFLN